MAETPSAEAPMTSEAMSERQGTGWNRCSADKTDCSERNRHPVQHSGTPFPPSPLTVRRIIITMTYLPQREI
jgi:hypothetical protein